MELGTMTTSWIPLTSDPHNGVSRPHTAGATAGRNAVGAEEVWFTIEMHVMGGLEIKSDISEQVAREMLAEEWRYDFRGATPDDREKVGRMISTQIAFAVEKKTGMFVLDGARGQKWLIPNAHILAASVTDATGRRDTPGFRQFEAVDVKEDPLPAPATA